MLWWTDDLETGEKNIDIQHKAIFEKAHEVFELGPNADIIQLKKVFVFLMNYSTNHFVEEEALMEDHNYPLLKEHKTHHNFYMDEIERLYTSLDENGNNEEVIEGVKVLIIEWLANHINGSDKAFIKFMNE